jgi:hypothetical protein
MRLSFLLYGVLYVVIEMVGSALEGIGWPQLTPLQIATAATDACLAVALVLTGMLAVKLGVQRWGATVRGWWDALGSPEAMGDDEPIGVRSWRSAPLELSGGPAEPPPPSAGTYAANPYSFAEPRWPADGGRRL